MNLKFSGVGGSTKQYALLAGLLATLGGVTVYNNSGSDVPPPATTTAKAPSTSKQVNLDTPVIPRPSTAPRSKRGKAKGNDDEWKLTVYAPEGTDITKIDPTLRLDLLAKVRSVGDAGGGRSLFDFYVPPPPPVKVDPIKPRVEAPPPPPPAVKETPKGPVTPPRTAIPYKYFGFEGRAQSGRLRALFVENENTFVRGPNEMLGNRYRVVRIGPASAEVEDTVEKFTDTLRIVDPAEPRQ
jgi:hypothetical protein